MTRRWGDEACDGSASGEKAGCQRRSAMGAERGRHRLSARWGSAGVGRALLRGDFRWDGGPCCAGAPGKKSLAEARRSLREGPCAFGPLGYGGCWVGVDLLVQGEGQVVQEGQRG